MKNVKFLAVTLTILSAASACAAEFKAAGLQMRETPMAAATLAATTKGQDMFGEMEKEFAHNQDITESDLNGTFEGVVYDNVRKDKEIRVRVAFLRDSENDKIYVVTDLFMEEDKALFTLLVGHAREALYYSDKRAYKQAVKNMVPVELSYKPQIRAFSGANLKQEMMFPYRRHEYSVMVNKHVSGKLMVSLHEQDEKMLYDRYFCGGLSQAR